MRLKRTLVSAIAALGLAASIMTPVALAADDDTSNNQSNAHVEVKDNGKFDVYFSAADFNLSTVTLNAQNPQGTATGKFRINYTDTKAWRSAFTVNVDAGDFNRDPGTAATIPSSGFKITHTDNVQQTLCGGPGAVNCDPNTVDFGDIGYRQNGVSVAQSSAGADWTTGNALNGNPEVQFGYEGVGTYTSYGDVNVALEVPVGTAPGQYHSELTLSVTLSQP